MEQAKEFDIILWGASGFTGRLVVEYIYEKYGVGKSLSWAMAGRSQSKLEEVREAVADSNVPILVADSRDRASLDAMVKRTKVVCTTVGPYAKYGSELVSACVAHQVHYCDLAGELQWMRRMIDKCHEAAVANGTKIVHTCGFDSIPSDMGVYYTQKMAQAETGQPAKRIDMRVRVMKGGLSGGTFASFKSTLEEVKKDKSIYKVLVNPYGLNPKGEESGADKPDLQAVKYDKRNKTWMYPFIMATINTKVVRRSNALMTYAYGKDFAYSEAMMSGDGSAGKWKAYRNALMIGLVFGAKPDSFLGKIVGKFLPKPGEGPSKEEREHGFFKFHFYTTLTDDTKAFAVVTGDKDPGYGSTSKMLAEAAICLAQDELPKGGGVLTPSVAMGDALLRRLEENAGLTFSFELK